MSVSNAAVPVEHFTGYIRVAATDRPLQVDFTVPVGATEGDKDSAFLKALSSIDGVDINYLSLGHGEDLERNMTPSGHAQLKVDLARARLSEALSELREARGEPHDEACTQCKGTGKDPISVIMEATPTEPCDACSGSGRVKRRYPFIVTGIEWDRTKPLDKPLFNKGTTWVSIRPVDPACNGKTYLGWLLGEMSLSMSASMGADGTMKIGYSFFNPAIFVPDLGKVVYGVESWWAPVKSAADLRQISDQDINSTWYVRLLRDLEQPTTSA